MTLYRFTLLGNTQIYVYAGTFEDALRTFRKSYGDTEFKSIEELPEFRDNILIQLD